MGILHPEGPGRQKAPAEVGLLLVRSSRGNISLNAHLFGLDAMAHAPVYGRSDTLLFLNSSVLLMASLPSVSRTLWDAGFLAPLCLFLRGIQALYRSPERPSSWGPCRPPPTNSTRSCQPTCPLRLTLGSGIHPRRLGSGPNTITVQGPLEPTSILTVYTAAPPPPPRIPGREVSTRELL